MDFLKAHDLLDRGWVLRGMAALGFKAQAVRTVSMLQTASSSTVTYNANAATAPLVPPGIDGTGGCVSCHHTAGQHTCSSLPYARGQHVHRHHLQAAGCIGP